MIGKFIYSWLTAQSSITNVVGSGADAAIWPLLPQDPKIFPHIVYETSEGHRTQTLTTSGNPHYARVILTLRGRDDTGYKDVQTLAEAILGDPDDGTVRLDGYTSTNTYGSTGIRVQSCLLESWRDFDEPPAPGSESRLHVCQLTFSVWYDE